ncbi:glutamine synthetase [Pseudomonas corrugata]|uniref:glutamine synthetase n=1 Tax=Pseudomonas corrugata TaxID=47879 RepID=UPI00087CD0A6|nr:hypothetical protein SAMN04490183_4647 [Pseudomonas corrugata]
MRIILKFVFACWMLSGPLEASAQTSLLANCTRSANLLACSDGQGNAYSVMTAGNTVYLRGFEVKGSRHWAQTTSRYGQLTFFTGLASDGEAWVGYSRRVGWTTLNRFSSSGGAAGKFICGRINGCQDSR